MSRLLSHNDPAAELEELRARAASIEAELSIIYAALDVARERYPQNNALQALARIATRNSHLAIRPTCED